ncbi:MAG: glycosyltransferase [Bacteroidota bacterium]
MSQRLHICFTFVGDVTRDSRLRRFASACADAAEVTVIQLTELWEGNEGNEGNTGNEGKFNLISFPMKGSLRQKLPKFWRLASKSARHLGADLLIASDLYSLPAAARAAKALHRPLMYDARELYTSVAALQGRPLMQRFWSWTERRYAKRAALVFTVNESIAEILRQRYPDVRVIRNLPDFPIPTASDKLREVCAIPADRRILLSQGGLQQGRGAYILLEALMELPDCHLVFLGDGALRDEIKASAQINGIADRVTILPAVPSTELPVYTASADLGMCLIENLGQSYFFSLPNKLFEYIASGVPVIGSDFPEIGAVLRETGAGIAIDPTNLKLVCKAIRTLLDDSDRYTRTRAACLAATEEYHWEKERRVLLQAVHESESAGR